MYHFATESRTIFMLVNTLLLTAIMSGKKYFVMFFHACVLELCYGNRLNILKSIDRKIKYMKKRS